MYHVRHADYIKAAETFGLPVLRIFFRHALPNSLGPVPSLLAFGIAGAVLAESSLSFLGIGLPPEVYTWGKLLAQGRANPSAWWVTLLPGLLIFGTISSFHRLGEMLSEDPTREKTSIIRYFR
jgi:peptide/nickel transport system permease protein